METIRILLLEDNEREIISFNSTIERLNNDDISFEIKNYKNVYDSIIYKDILNTKYDFVIVDLKLEGDSDIYGGNTFLQLISHNLNIPIIINSSLLSDLDQEFNSSDNPLIKQFDSTLHNTEEILNYIKEIYSTGITKVLGKEGEIFNTLNSLIWKGGLSNIKEWKKFQNGELSKKSLSRYILSHLHNNLSRDSKDFHPEEIYLKHMGENKFITGTIIEKENNFYIILNPSCDLAQCNVDYYIICGITPFNPNNISDLITTKQELLSASTEGQKEKKQKKINGLLKEIKQDSSKYTKFLPKSTLFNGGYVNFRDLHIVSFSNISDYRIICNISTFFLKDIVADFGYYYSRQGQPDIDNNLLIE